jgi:hypothetical protein
MRGYVRKEAFVKDERAPLGTRYDVWFAGKEHAMYWETMDEARSAVTFFPAAANTSVQVSRLRSVRLESL